MAGSRLPDHEVSVYKVEASFSCGGKSDYAVSSFTMSWGMNEIPRASILLPLNHTSSKQRVTVFRSSDPSRYARRKTLDEVQSVMDSDDNSCSFSFSSSKMDGPGPSGLSMSVDGWRVVGVRLEPQNRVSPGGVVVDIAHPMSKLRSSPGFFVVNDRKFYEDLEDKVKKADSVLAVADATLDALEKYIGSANESPLGNEDSSFAVEGAKVRLQNYIASGELSMLPYLYMFPDDSKEYAATACKIELAKQFCNLGNSVPLDSFVGLCNALGAYFRVSPTDRTATMHILQPWVRGVAPEIDGETVYQTQLAPDSDPICGIRVRGYTVSKVSCNQSTYSDNKPLADSGSGKGTGSYTGDTLLYYQSVGKIINTAMEPFAENMVSTAAILKARGDKDKVSTKSSDGARPASVNRLDKGLYDKMVAITGGESTGKDVLAKMLKATACTTFARMFRRTASASVILPAAVPYDSIPAIGAFATVSVGTGGKDITGVVSHIDLSGSCSNGTCSCTYRLDYAGKPPEKGAKAVNMIWDAAGSGT